MNNKFNLNNTKLISPLAGDELATERKIIILLPALLIFFRQPSY